jgi:hypothetical protein
MTTPHQPQAQPFPRGYHSPLNTMNHNNPLFDSFKCVAELQKQLDSVNHYALDAIKRCYTKPEDLVAYIERQGTPVYVINNHTLGNLLMFFYGIDPGFIPPSDDLKYQQLCSILKKLYPKPYCNTDRGIIVTTQQLFSVSFLAHQMHHWVSFRSGLPGYSETSRKQYKKFWAVNKGVIGPEVYSMSADEIMSLKQAINRDMEALRFIQQMAREVLAPAHQATQVSHGKAMI